MCLWPKIWMSKYFNTRFQKMKLNWVLFLVVTIECSMVLDSTNQEGIYFNDYCPKMEHCPEGAHVLCMHYDPVNVMGPNCGVGFNVSITHNFVERLLELMNEMRAKLANGEEVGKDNKPLPRAYGMVRVKWDAELATFAQIWANRCVLRHDLCRATKRFSNPGQTVGITRFTYPEWNTVKKYVPEMATEPGLNDKKVWYSMNNNIKLLYTGKAGVTKEMINSAPNLEMNKNGILRGYLDIVSSATTHVGCGISAGTSYFGQSTQEEVIVNYLEIVCNFGGSPLPGKKVYQTDPPKDVGWTVKCGCPPGYYEDESCLCIERDDLSKIETVNTTKANWSETNDIMTCNDDNPKCQPSMLLLPIFVPEDAPQENLYHPPENLTFHKNDDENFDTPRNHGLGNEYPDTNMIKNADENKLSNHKILNKQISKTGDARQKDVRKRYFNNVFMPKQRSSRSSVHLPANKNLSVNISSNHNILKKQISKSNGTRKKDVRKRYFDNIVIFKKKSLNSESPVLNRGDISPKKNAKTTRRNSIFTKVSEFKLPVKKNNKNIEGFLKDGSTFKSSTNKIIKDVTPRKDFSNVQELADAYLNKKHNKSAKYENHTVTVKYDEPPKHSMDSKAKKSSFQDLNIPLINKFYDVKNSSEEDTKLLSLLDNLEQEVNRNKLNDNVKEVIDAKIRKIYGNVVGDYDRLLKFERQELLDDLIEDIGQKYNIEKFKPKDKDTMLPNLDETEQPEIELPRPKQRNQNSMKLYDKPSFEQYETKYGIIDTDERDVQGNYLEKSKSIYTKDDKTDNYMRDTRNLNKHKGRYQKLLDEADLQIDDKRRKYYQDKINYLERKIHSIRGYRRQNDLNQDNGRHLRPLVTPHDNIKKTRSTNNVQSFYLPDRAKFLNGF